MWGGLWWIRNRWFFFYLIFYNKGCSSSRKRMCGNTCSSLMCLWLCVCVSVCHCVCVCVCVIWCAFPFIDATFVNIDRLKASPFLIINTFTVSRETAVRRFYYRRKVQFIKTNQCPGSLACVLAVQEVRKSSVACRRLLQCRGSGRHQAWLCLAVLDLKVTLWRLSRNQFHPRRSVMVTLLQCS